MQGNSCLPPYFATVRFLSSLERFSLGDLSRGGGGGGGGGKHSRGKCSFLNETPHNSRAVNEQLCTGIPAISFFKPVLQSHTDTLQTQVDQSSSAHFDHQRYELTVSAVHVVTFVHVQVILPN